MDVDDMRQPTAQMVVVTIVSLPQRGSHCLGALG
jgi:hypothetical protein